MQMDRRKAMSAAAAMAAVSMIPGEAAAAGKLDLTSPAGRLRAYMLLRGGLDEQLVVSWMSARYYGVVEDAMTPMFNVRSVVFSRYRKVLAGPYAGGYEAVNGEVAWFFDPETNRALDTWRNPWTGRDVKVEGSGFAPSKLYFAPDLSMHLAHEMPGLEMAHDVLPFEIRGQDVYLTERSRTAMHIPGAARPYRYSESNTYRTTLAALSAPGARHVPCDVSFANVCSWRPWLGMGDHPGHMMATGMGRQNATLASVPPEWREAAAQRRPELLSKPGALLDDLWNKR